MPIKFKKLFATSALLLAIATNAQARVAAFTVLCHPVPNAEVDGLVHGTIVTQYGRPIRFVARCINDLSGSNFPDIPERSGKVVEIRLEVYILLSNKQDPAFPKSNICSAISDNSFLALRCDADPIGAIGAVDVQVSIGD